MRHAALGRLVAVAALVLAVPAAAQTYGPQPGFSQPGYQPNPYQPNPYQQNPYQPGPAPSFGAPPSLVGTWTPFTFL